MSAPPSRPDRAWRVAVTRDEPADGPLTRALEAAAFVAVPCAVLVAQPPPDPGGLARVAAGLDGYDWVVATGPRAVAALTAARGSRWPAGLRTAAVGLRTAEALTAHGAWPPPLAAANADALWARLRDAERWPTRRVLVATTTGGDHLVADGLRDVGAAVEEVDAYRMAPRPLADIAADWQRGDIDAAVVAGAATATTLILAVGTGALARLAALLAVGPATADALRRAEVACHLAADGDFAAAAESLAALRDARVGP
ncbi:MAG: uroporphyrinogen-III synthase [Vicinamibacterales bacterium]